MTVLSDLAILIRIFGPLCEFILRKLSLTPFRKLGIVRTALSVTDTGDEWVAQRTLSVRSSHSPGMVVRSIAWEKSFLLTFTRAWGIFLFQSLSPSSQRLSASV